MNQNQNQYQNQNPYQNQNQSESAMNNANVARPPVTAADIPLTLKARYVGTGIVIGVFISPIVRKTISKIQPKFDTLLDNLTGQAEGLVEKGADLLAKAKDVLKKSETETEEHDHDHDHDHAHEPRPARSKGTKEKLVQ